MTSILLDNTFSSIYFCCFCWCWRCYCFYRSCYSNDCDCCGVLTKFALYGQLIFIVTSARSSSLFYLNSFIYVWIYVKGYAYAIVVVAQLLKAARNNILFSEVQNIIFLFDKRFNAFNVLFYFYSTVVMANQ